MRAFGQRMKKNLLIYLRTNWLDLVDPRVRALGSNNAFVLNLTYIYPYTFTDTLQMHLGVFYSVHLDTQQGQLTSHTVGFF